jgi:hypothetical protein
MRQARRNIMGAMHAVEYAAVANRTIGLTAHLRSNCFPPVPYAMIPVAEQAIDLCNDGGVGETIDLPDGITWRGQDHVPAHVVVTDLHLEAWVNGYDDEDDWS